MPEIVIDEEDVPLTELPEVTLPLEEEGEVLGAEDVVEEEGIVAGEEEIIAATGDNNHMVGAFGGMFAALAGMFLLRKKKENN